MLRGAVGGRYHALGPKGVSAEAGGAAGWLAVVNHRRLQEPRVTRLWVLCGRLRRSAPEPGNSLFSTVLPTLPAGEA